MWIALQKNKHPSSTGLKVGLRPSSHGTLDWLNISDLPTSIAYSLWELWEFLNSVHLRSIDYDIGRFIARCGSICMTGLFPSSPRPSLPTSFSPLIKTSSLVVCTIMSHILLYAIFNVGLRRSKIRLNAKAKWQTPISNLIKPQPSVRVWWERERERTISIFKTFSPYYRFRKGDSSAVHSILLQFFKN